MGTSFIFDMDFFGLNSMFLSYWVSNELILKHLLLSFVESAIMNEYKFPWRSQPMPGELEIWDLWCDPIPPKICGSMKSLLDMGQLLLGVPAWTGWTYQGLFHPQPFWLHDLLLSSSTFRAISCGGWFYQCWEAEVVGAVSSHLPRL